MDFLYLCLYLVGVLDSNEPAESLSYPSWPSLSFNPFKSQSSSSDSGYHSNSSGTDSAEDSGAQGIHLLLRPPDLLTPSLPPPLPPFTQPTLTPPPPWDHVPFLEEAWGSGDYLETLSFMVPDGEELALATPLPNNPYGNDDEEDDDGGNWFSYNYAFPARPTIPLSSRLPLSPSSPTADPPLYTRPSHPDVFPTWDEDYDLEDMMPLEPTELLLPDMNSLEYYTNLLARERERNIDQERVSPPDTEPGIKPTTTQTHQSSLTPPPTSSPPELDAKHPSAGPTLPPILLESISIQTPSANWTPTSRPKADFPDHSRYPLSPPSNTTGQIPSSPPLGLPARPDRPGRPPLVPERPQTPTTRVTTTVATTMSTPGTTTTQITAISLTRAPPVTTPRAAQSPPSRQYLCNVTKPEMYLVRVGKAPNRHVT